VDLEPEAPKGITPLKKVYEYEPIPEGLTKEEAKLIIGSQVCLWGEFTPTRNICELMLYPRVLANAEVGWTDPSLKNWNRFQHAVEMNFKRLDRDKVIYSRSMYNPFISFAADSLQLVAKVHLFTDSDLHNVRFTNNGSEPTVSSTKYAGVFNAELNSVIKAAIFDDKGNKLGQTVTRTLSPSKK
jgi:hexosaminidase